MNSNIEGRILPGDRRRNRLLLQSRRSPPRCTVVRCRGDRRSPRCDPRRVSLAADEELGQTRAGDVLRSRSAKAAVPSATPPVGRAHVRCDAVLHATRAACWWRRCRRYCRSQTTTGRRIPQPVLVTEPFLTSALSRPGWTRGAGDRVDGDLPHLLGGQHDPPSTAVAPPESPLPAPRNDRNPVRAGPSAEPPAPLRFPWVARLPAGCRRRDPAPGRAGRKPGCRIGDGEDTSSTPPVWAIRSASGYCTGSIVGSKQCSGGAGCPERP